MIPTRLLVLLACAACSGPDRAPESAEGGGREETFSAWLDGERGATTASRADPAAWKPAATPLFTRWGRAVDPTRVWSEYPRPQFVRERWQSLNGLWEFAAARADEAPPHGTTLPETILVPFPMESALSGIGRHHERAWYRRTFELDPAWRSARVLLHCEAVDWRCSVWLNGAQLGTHEGGYDAFSFDVTEFLRPGALQELVLGVYDPTEQGDQPRGKQTTRPEGIWYTPSSGVWQSVWLEPVPATRIVDFDVATALRQNQLTLEVEIEGADSGLELGVRLLDQGREVARASGLPGTPLELRPPVLRPWSPADPFLYDLELELRGGGRVLDRVTGYVGAREVALRVDAQGVPRIELNGAPLFQVGLLDQGFWPDGLYTAPGDEALRSDIELTKRLGFNLIRKHVKVEPKRWYTWCDRLGVLVWQDLPSADAQRPADLAILRRELDALVTQQDDHPCIVNWVVFNEGWGQFGTNSGKADATELAQGTERFVARVRALDPTRLVTAASGWTDTGAGDLHDIHVYPGPAAPPLGAVRAGVLGEFGGIGLAVDGHRWAAQHWGYQGAADSAALTARCVELLRGVHELAESSGLCAAVYTQTTDVETECNGLVTYDREVLKVDAERLARAARGEFPRRVTLVEDARRAEPLWRYTFDEPRGENWMLSNYDDGDWQRGPAGFGSAGTPGAVVRTDWNTNDIWLRREFELDAVPSTPCFLAIHHDEDLELYVNGQLPPIKLSGYTTGYELTALDPALLRSGRNLLALRCRQTTGGQYIDVGVVSEAP